MFVAPPLPSLTVADMSVVGAAVSRRQTVLGAVALVLQQPGLSAALRAALPQLGYREQQARQRVAS